MLRDIELGFKSVSDSMPLPMIVCRLCDGVIVYANIQGGLMLGANSGKLIGGYAPDWYYDAEDYKCFLRTWEEVGRIRNHKVLTRVAHGTPVWTVSSCQPLIFQGEKAMVAVFYQLTEGEHLEDTAHRGSSELTNENVFRSGDLTIDFSRYRVTIGGQQINLSATEYKLLSCLARNAGSVVTQAQLLNEVWGGSLPGDKQLLYVNLCRVRLKIGDNATKPRFIISNRGFGYMLSDRG